MEIKLVRSNTGSNAINSPRVMISIKNGPGSKDLRERGLWNIPTPTPTLAQATDQTYVPAPPALALSKPYRPI